MNSAFRGLHKAKARTEKLVRRNKRRVGVVESNRGLKVITIQLRNAREA